METINRRIGYFLRETPSSVKGQTTQFLIRYFMIDNNNTMFYTDNYSHLVHLVRSSKNIAEVFEKASKLDQYFIKEKVAEFKVSEIKKYKNPEHLAFLNQLHFEVVISFVAGSSDPNISQMSANLSARSDEPRKHQFFSFKDPCLQLLHRFVSGQDKRAAQLDEQALLVWPGIEPFTSLAKKKAEKEKLHAKYAEHVANLKAVIQIIDETKGNGGDPKAPKASVKEVKSNAELSEAKSELTKQPETTETDPETQDSAPPQQDSEFTTLDTPSDPQSPTQPAQDLENTAHPEDPKPQTQETEATHPASTEKDKQLPKEAAKGSETQQRNGKDKEHLTDSLSYSGDFRHDKRHGTGYFVLAGTGMVYVESINGRVAGI